MVLIPRIPLLFWSWAERLLRCLIFRSDYDILLFAVLLLLVIPPLLCFCNSFLSAYSDLPLLSFISLCLRILKPNWYLPSEYFSFYCCMDCFGFDAAQDWILCPIQSGFSLYSCTGGGKKGLPREFLRRLLSVSCSVKGRNRVWVVLIFFCSPTIVCSF